jgi:hypothetical protein
MQQREQLRLVFQIRTRRISKRIARSAIFLVEQVANVRRVLAGNSQVFTDLFVQILGQRLRAFNAQPVQIEIFRVLAGFKQSLRFL